VAKEIENVFIWTGIIENINVIKEGTACRMTHDYPMLPFGLQGKSLRPGATNRH
jgi:hypothetical protein